MSIVLAQFNVTKVSKAALTPTLLHISKNTTQNIVQGGIILSCSYQKKISYIIPGLKPS